MRSLLLVVPLLASLAACWRTDPLYCERNADCADVAGRPFCDVAGTYPGSEGVAQTCIADPGGSCTLDADCTDPALPACSAAGACRECGPTHACGPDEPVCDVAESTCAGCTSATDCAAFADRPQCSLADGACVGCTSDADCAATGQACLEATRTCGACTADADCESSLCDSVNGSCVPEDAILYVATDGVDGDCMRSSPCNTIDAAHGLVRAGRATIVLAPGSYEGGSFLGKSFVLVGHGATITTRLTVGGDSSIRGLELRAVLVADGGGTMQFTDLVVDDVDAGDVTYGAVLIQNATVTIARSTIRRTRRGSAISVERDGLLTLLDSEVSANGAAMNMLRSTRLSHVARSRIIANDYGVMAAGRFRFTNNIFVSNGGRAIDMANTTFSQVEHNTFVNNGTGTNDGGVRCLARNADVIVTNNIFFANTTNENQLQVSAECAATYSLIGPEGQPTGTGNFNVAPDFVDPATNDYRLRGTSGARDRANPSRSRTPPAEIVTDDIDGQARPATNVDVGADEYVP